MTDEELGHHAKGRGALVGMWEVGDDVLLEVPRDPLQAATQQR